MDFKLHDFIARLPRPRAARAGLTLACAVLAGALAPACGHQGDDTAGTDGGGGAAGGGGAGGSAGSAGAAGSGGAGGASAPLTINTDKGPVEGYLLDSTRAFLGVPFAAPPTGDLRWKPPAPHAAWTDPIKANKKSKSCAQVTPLAGKFDTNSAEDCLYLNVWTPSKPSSSTLPVLLWIHGGAFVLGSGGEAAYDGKNLSEATGMVVVTVNYRLGPLGFLAMDLLKAEDKAHPSTGDYGLEDQRFAMEWVKTNIAAFGGDPGKVTLFGESAGGISACMHLVSPLSKGLFHRAILESGPCNIGNAEQPALDQGKAFADALGCSADPDVLECLRGKPIEEVMSALPSSTDFFFGGGANWFPVLDGYNLPDSPMKLLEEGKFEKMPVILGSNADEGTLFFYLAGDNGKVADEAAFEALSEQFVPGHGKDVVAKYPVAMYGTAQKAAMAAVGHAVFVCPARRAARALVKGGASTHLYHFTHAPEGTLLPDLGAFHSAEIKFVFGNAGQLIPGVPEGEELKLSQAMMGYWSRLADKGEPNGDMAFDWPGYTDAVEENIVFDLSLSKQADLHKDLCDFWDSVVTLPP